MVRKPCARCGMLKPEGEDGTLCSICYKKLVHDPPSKPKKKSSPTPADRRDKEVVEMREGAGFGLTDKIPYFQRSGDPFESTWNSIQKGRFHGYTQSNIGDRPMKQGKAKAWSQSRKVKRGRTARRYKRNKSRGTVRPTMRRQLGAGGKRYSTKR